jgi:hypothetical protein
LKIVDCCLIDSACRQLKESMLQQYSVFKLADFKLMGRGSEGTDTNPPEANVKPRPRVQCTTAFSTTGLMDRPRKGGRY